MATHPAMHLACLKFLRCNSPSLGHDWLFLSFQRVNVPTLADVMSIIKLHRVSLQVCFENQSHSPQFRFLKLYLISSVFVPSAGR